MSKLYQLLLFPPRKINLIVGRPWGQFQGASNSAMLSTMTRMSLNDKGSPIIQDFLHALDARILFILQHLTFFSFFPN